MGACLSSDIEIVLESLKINHKNHQTNHCSLDRIISFINHRSVKALYIFSQWSWGDFISPNLLPIKLWIDSILSIRRMSWLFNDSVTSFNCIASSLFGEFSYRIDRKVYCGSTLINFKFGQFYALNSIYDRNTHRI